MRYNVYGHTRKTMLHFSSLRLKHEIIFHFAECGIICRHKNIYTYDMDKVKPEKLYMNKVGGTFQTSKNAEHQEHDNHRSD